MQMDAVPFRNAVDLTSLQRGFWIGQQRHPDAPLYNMGHSFRIHGPIDPDRFASAFDRVVAGTDVLRAVVMGDEKGNPQLRFAAAAPVHGYEDLRSTNDPEAELEAILAAQLARRFPDGQFLYESRLLRLAENEFVWCLTLHHLIVDLLSVSLIFDRVSALYESNAESETAWPAFADYARRFAAPPGSKRAERVQAYWQLNALSESDEPLGLFGNTPDGDTRSQRIALRLGPGRSLRIRDLARQPPFGSLTPELGAMNVFMTALRAFLHRFGDRDRVVIGTPLHNRSSRPFQSTVGLLINMVPIADAVSTDDSFESLAGRAARATMTATRFAAEPAPDSELDRGFDAVLNYLTGRFGEFAGMHCMFEWHHPGHADSHHAVRLQVQDFAGDDEYTLFVDVNESLLKGQDRHRVPSRLLRLLDACLDDPSQPIHDVDVFSDDERRALGNFNNTRARLTVAESLPELLAAAWPDDEERVAAECGGRTLTYGELDRRSAKVAGALEARGIGHGDIVSVSMPRSFDFVVALIGILRAGAAFLPIDPAQPAKRVARILEDARPALTLTSGGIGFDTGHAETELEAFVAEDQPAAAQAAPPRPGDAAYVIYTSGSSGEPKGVVIEHAGIVNYVAWAADYYPGEVGVRRPAMPLFSSIGVDLTLTSVFLPLVAGGRIVIYPATDPRNDLSIIDVVDADAVDIVKLTPAHLGLLQKLGKRANRPRGLVLGGENLSVAAAHRSQTVFPGCAALFNEYGPTETVVGCMTHRFDPHADTGASVPIGRPIPNMRVYVLDRFGKPVPPGILGTLFIAGVSLAREYLNKPAATAAVFGPMPNAGEDRAYCSGDLARFDASGALTYAGRGDDQLKIRGNRVEPGEIEARLASHPDVEAAAVIEMRDASSAGRIHDGDEPGRRCPRCGLPGNYPEAHLEPDTGVCRLCRQYERYRSRIEQYFGSRDELQAIVDDVVARKPEGEHAIVLTSGGKDSTFALHQLVGMGLRPIVFTLDNGFISEEALANVRRVVEDLDLELVIGRTRHMPAIFADSLQRHCNVCNGCFKTIYTLSINLAEERAVDTIFTGLSRGQLFETRLAPEMFAGKDFSVSAIERDIATARIAYHRRHDAVNRLLDVSVFDDDRLFERIRFVDFYRYRDVDLDELYDYLARKVSWLRPSDTGRSTNCLINEAGISVHKARRGYHNYALPYSWDVRLGHKTREQALAELDDDIDEARVRQMLDEVGYVPPAEDGDTRLVAAYTASSDLEPDRLREWLEKELPSYMLPAQLTRLDALPLTVAGKVDRRRLAGQLDTAGRRSDDTKPRTELERTVVALWSEALDLERIGVHENFFDLGGTSLPALLIVSRAAQLFDVEFRLPDFFRMPTPAGMARALEKALVVALDSMSDAEVDAELRKAEKDGLTR